MEKLTPKGNEAQTTDHNGNGMELRLVSIDSLSIPQHHPRSDYGNLETLQGSIKRDGLQEPLLVYEIEAGKFGIIDGARRLKAFQEMGLKQISCLINKGISEAEAAHLSYVKNVERQTLSVIEIARHIKAMRDDFGYTLSELELKGYGSPATISNKLKLLDLPDKVQRQLQDGTLPTAHANALSKLSTKEAQELMAKRIGDGDMTVKTTERQIDRYLAKKEASKEDKAKESVVSNNSDHDIPGMVYFDNPRNMGKVPAKSVNLLVTNITNVDEIEDVMDEIGRVMAPGGRLAITVIDRTDSPVSNILQIKPTLPICQKRLQKHKIYLTDRIVAIRPADRCEADLNSKGVNTHDTPHTYYKIKNCSNTVYIFMAKGEREKPSAEIISQSKLSKEQEMAWVKGVWEVEPEEQYNRLIQMYSYVGDKVLDPYLGDGTTLKVVKELGRVGIGYEKDIKNKPAIMKNLGLIPEEVAVKSSKLMSEYVKQTMPPEVDITRLFVDAPAEGTNEDDLGKSSKPEPGFFGRMTQFESNEFEEVAEEETVS